MGFAALLARSLPATLRVGRPIGKTADPTLLSLLHHRSKLFFDLLLELFVFGCQIRKLSLKLASFGDLCAPVRIDLLLEEIQCVSFEGHLADIDFEIGQLLIVIVSVDSLLLLDLDEFAVNGHSDLLLLLIILPFGHLTPQLALKVPDSSIGFCNILVDTFDFSFLVDTFLVNLAHKLFVIGIWALLGHYIGRLFYARG